MHPSHPVHRAIAAALAALVLAATAAMPAFATVDPPLIPKPTGAPKNVNDYPSKAAFDAAEDAYVKALAEWDQAENAAERAAADAAFKAAQDQRIAQETAQLAAEKAARDARAQAEAARAAARQAQYAAEEQAKPWCADLEAAGIPFPTLPDPPIDNHQPSAHSPCRRGPGSLPPCDAVDTTTTWCYQTTNPDNLQAYSTHAPAPLDKTEYRSELQVKNGLFVVCQYVTYTTLSVDLDATRVASRDTTPLGCTPVNS